MAAWFHLKQLLLLLGWFVLAATAKSATEIKPAGRFIKRDEPPKAEFQVLVASFGDAMEQETEINIMLPPTQGDYMLCTNPLDRLTPEEFTQWQHRAQNWTFSSNVALVVAVGGCSADVKARILLDLQERISPKINVLLVYETSGMHPNWFVSLRPDSREQLAALNQQVGILYLPYKHTKSLLPVLKGKKSARYLQGDAYFMSPNNDKWQFEHSVTGSWIPVDVDQAIRNDNAEYEFETHDDFYWIRYVLFSLLIMSPCLRAAYLFHAGGGRILWRRNERGRITGLQYIP